MRLLVFGSGVHYRLLQGLLSRILPQTCRPIPSKQSAPVQESVDHEDQHQSDQEPVGPMKSPSHVSPPYARTIGLHSTIHAACQ